MRKCWTTWGKKWFLLCSSVGKLFFRLLLGRVARCLLHGVIRASWASGLGWWQGAFQIGTKKH